MDTPFNIMIGLCIVIDWTICFGFDVAVNNETNANNTQAEAIDCDFEEGLCGWTSSKFSDNSSHWIRVSGMKSEKSNGDVLGTYNTTRSRYYLRVNTTDSSASLKSPLILGSSGTVWLTLWFNIDGNLQISATRDDDLRGINYLDVFGDGTWRQAEIPFVINSTFQIIFKYYPPHCHRPTEIAIDDITLVKESGPKLATIVSRTSFVDGFWGDVSCVVLSGMVPTEVGTLDLTWLRNGNVIQQTSRVIYETRRYNSTFGQMVQGYLEFTPVFRTDSGEYSCFGHGHHNISHRADFNVKVNQEPKVQVSPTLAYVNERDTLTLTCNITNTQEFILRLYQDRHCYDHDDYYYDFFHPDFFRGSESKDNTSIIRWCFGDIEIVQGWLSSYRIVDESPTLSHLQILQPVQEIVYCGVWECTDQSEIVLLQEDEPVCHENSENGVIWRKTRAGVKQERQCPNGFAGRVSRVCDDNGNWKGVNFSACMVGAFDRIREIINADSDVESHTFEGAINMIHEVLKEEQHDSLQELEVNKIKNGAEILKEISTANVIFNSVAEASESTKAFAVAVSTLVRRTKNVLQGQQDNIQSQTKLDVGLAVVQSVENFGRSVIRYLDTNQSVGIRTENMEMLLKKAPSKQGIYFPQGVDEENGEISKFEVSFQTLKSLGITDEISLIAARYRELGALLYSQPRNYPNSTEKPTGFSRYPDRRAVVNSDVLSLSLNVTTDFIDPPIMLTFEQREVELQEPACVFYNTLTSEWSTDGCTLVSSSRQTTVCQCTHLTNFAILMSPSTTEPTQSHKEGLKVISLVGCSISVSCCLITVLVYIKFWRYVQSRRSALILSLSFVLAAGYLLFMLGVDKTENEAGCTVIAVFLHYIFLTVFSIMLAIAIDIVLAIVQVFVSTSKWWPLLLFAWGSPVIIVGISLGATQLKGYGDKHFCWLRGTTLYAFVAPVLLIILVNAGILIYALKVMYSTHFMKSKSPKQRAKSGIRSVCSLLPLLGLTWLFGVLAINEDLVVFQYLFAIFNSAQGILVFVFHCALNGQIRKAVIQRFRRRRVLHISGTTSKDDSIKTKSTVACEASRTGIEMTNQDPETDGESTIHTKKEGHEAQEDSTTGADGQRMSPEEPTAMTNAAYEQDAEELKDVVQD